LLAKAIWVDLVGSKPPASHSVWLPDEGIKFFVAALSVFENNLMDFLTKYRQSIFLIILYNFKILKIRVELYYLNNSNIIYII
jgi:hypothetical protein